MNTRYANVNGERRLASRGTTGECPLCKNAVRAYCGEINVWHWRHVNASQCDSWYEPETEWHKSWKNQFPMSWQEVVMFDQATGEKHIADVKTEKGIVVEFQNSPISPAELRSRELFYGDMIWIVNAEEFRDRFQIYSKVNAEIRQLESKVTRGSQRIKEYFSQCEEKVVSELSELQSEIKKLQHSKEDLESRLSEIRAIDNEEIEKLVTSVLGQMMQSDYEYNEHHYDLRRLVPEDLKNQLLELKNKIKSADIELKQTNRKIEEIEALPESDVISGYKLVHQNWIQNWINEGNRARAKVVELKSKETFFPNIQSISSNADLRSYKLYEAKYEFILDLREELVRLIARVADIKNNLELFQQQLLENVEEVRKLAYGWHAAEVKKLNKQLQDKEIEISQKEKESKLQTEASVSNKQLLLSEMNKAIDQLSRNYQKEKSRIMATNKGLYYLEWKRERKVWREAKCPIYFDVGEWLFVWESESLFRKVERETLLNQLLH